MEKFNNNITIVTETLSETNSYMNSKKNIL